MRVRRPWPCQRESVGQRESCLEQRERGHDGIPIARQADEEPTIGWDEVWGNGAKFDARRSLARIPSVGRHPSADRDEPVWYTTHARAIVETALANVILFPHGSLEEIVPADQINRWVASARTFLRMHVMASKIGRRLEGQRRRTWYCWQRTLHPCRRWDTTHTWRLPLGYGANGRRAQGTGTPTLAVALRETREESGLDVRALDDAIFDIDVHRIPARGREPAHLHFDVRFLVQAGHDRFKVSEESQALAWVTQHSAE